ncbi:MAG: hypothetical protein E6I75_26635, partial [Chloroflexi bacterium]
LSLAQSNPSDAVATADTADGRSLLSPREAEVASLIAKGLSNREIADDRSADVAPGAAGHTLRAFGGLLRTNVLVRVTAAAVMTRLSRWRPGPMT